MMDGREDESGGQAFHAQLLQGVEEGVELRLVLKCKINKLVHHLLINQVQAIKCKYSNQQILQEIIHWTIS